MMTPALPPNSRSTRFFPDLAFSIQPTPTLPVKLKTLKRGSVTICSATVLSQGKTLKAPAGNPASSTISPSISAVNGVCGAGFKTMGFPQAKQGATL